MLAHENTLTLRPAIDCDIITKKLMLSVGIAVVSMSLAA